VALAETVGSMGVWPDAFLLNKLQK
jgi:hypothetical protein